MMPELPGEAVPLALLGPQEQRAQLREAQHGARHAQVAMDRVV
jgi:hypothetical protein